MTDLTYECKRNKLISMAVLFANEKHGKFPPGANRETWYFDWNVAFLGEMDRLARERGLIS